MIGKYRPLTLAVLLLLALALISGCGRSASTSSDSPATSTNAASVASVANIPITTSTPAGSGTVKSIAWYVYHPVTTLDPALTFDTPEWEAVFSMCDSLLRVTASGNLEPGLAKSVTRPDPTTLVFTLRSGVKFWNGAPLTAADVVYSLERQLNPKLGAVYAQWFGRVKSIEATGVDEVTVKLTQPDALFERVMAGPEGLIVSKSFAEKAGKGFGTPAKGIMCSGPYEFGSWQPGGNVVMKRNPSYWDASNSARVDQVTLENVSDPATLAAALSTGQINGTYDVPANALDQLRSSGTLAAGPASEIYVLMQSTNQGPMADLRVREALADAIDYNGIDQTLFGGTASIAKAIAGPGMWSYSKNVFESGWNALPEPHQDLAAAKALVKEAAPTRPIVLATSSQIAPFGDLANEVQSAAAQVGLKVTIKNLSALAFYGLFGDPSARKGIDGFFALQNSETADPLQLYLRFGGPGVGYKNFADYDNPQVNALLQKARGTYDDNQRAELVVDAQKIIMHDLPWIPLASPHVLLYMHGKLTGAAPTFYGGWLGPWASQLGEGS